jgi:hypothetical protein
LSIISGSHQNDIILNTIKEKEKLLQPKPPNPVSWSQISWYQIFPLVCAGMAEPEK